MATGVNVKMGVSGVSQFKQSMNQAKQAVKTLDAQLALNEKQLKAGGDAEALMAEKSALLEAKLENQKKVADEAQKALDEMTRNGVDRASKAYQDMYRTMIDAKGALLDTEGAINGVEQAGDNAASGVSEMNSQLANINKGVSFENVTSGIEKISSAMSDAAKKAIELGKRIVSDVLGAGSWADDLTTRAKYFEMTPEELQRAEKTAKLIDTPVDAIVNAQKKLRKGLGSADQGVMGAYAELFGEGYDPTAKGWEQAFWDAGEAIMKFANEEEKEVYAQRLFGRSWNELIPLFEEGKDKYDEMNASWSVVSEENIKKLTEMDDANQKLQNEWETFKLTLESTLAGPMTTVMEKITDLVGELNKYLESPEGQEKLAQIGETIGGLIDNLLNVDPEKVIGGLQTVIEKITEALTWISENHESVGTALGAIATAFGAIKLGTLALNIGKIVSGFQTLWKGAGNPLPSVPGTDGTGGTGTTAGGGFLTAAWNHITAAAPAAASWIGANGVPVFDWLMHESPLAGVLNGQETMGDFLSRTGAQIQENAGTFGQDLANLFDPNFRRYQNMTGNGLTEEQERNLGRFYQSYSWYKKLNGEMTPEQWDAYHSAGNDLTKSFAGQEELLAYYMEKMKTYEGGKYWGTLGDDFFNKAPLDKMTETASETGQAVEKNTKGTEAVTDAAKKMPKETSEAIKQSLSGMKIYINGYQLAQVVGEIQGGAVLTLQ